MIKHFVIFTFEENYFTDDNYNEYVEAFRIIENAFDGIKSVSIHRNFLDRPANMVLGEYLNHPEHVRMGQKYNPHVTNRVSFDYKL